MKIDLRKTKAVTVTTALPEAEDDELILDESSTDWQEKLGLDLSRKQWIGIFIRMVFLISGLIGLKMYEVKNINRLNMQKSVLSEKLEEVKTKKENIEKQIATFGSLSSQSRQFNEKLDIIQSIINNRVWAIKGLDQIRSNIPGKVWLDKIQYRKKTFIIEGASISNKQIERFVEALENTHLFSQVNLNQMVEETKTARNVGGLKNRFFTIHSILK